MMFHELTILALAVILGIAQLIAATHTATQQRGMDWNFSARDGKWPELTGVAARLDRAFKNFMETFPFFVAAVLLVEARRHNSDLSLWGATLYLVMRTAHVFIYAAGIPKLRTVVWILSMVGLVMVLIRAF